MIHQQIKLESTSYKLAFKDEYERQAAKLMEPNIEGDNSISRESDFYSKYEDVVDDVIDLAAELRERVKKESGMYIVETKSKPETRSLEQMGYPDGYAVFNSFESACSLCFSLLLKAGVW